MSGQPKAVRTHSWRGNQTCSGWWFQPLWKIWVRQLRLFFTIYEIPWFQSPPSSNQCLACVLDWTNVPSGVFFSMACVREMPQQFDDFPQPEHQGRWHHRQIHQASRRLGCPGRRVTKGALRGALCMSLRSKLGVSQAWGTPTPWVSHGLPMKVSHGLPMKETCWIV